MDLDNLESWWNEHQDEYIEDLRGFVEIPSIAIEGKDGYPFGRPCYDALIYIQRLMRRYGLDAALIKDVFAKGSYNKDAEKAIAIACHSDVVPVDGEWERSPFELFLKDNHLVGRGTTDNKGATIAALYALRYLREMGYESKHDLELLVGSAEEIGMPDVRLAFPNGTGAIFTLVPDSGFPLSYGEKASLKAKIRIDLRNSSIISIEGGQGTGVIDKAVCSYYKDSAICTLEASGKAKHSATPDGGECAFLALLKSLDEMGLIPDDSELKRVRESFIDFYGTGLDLNAADDEFGPLTLVITKAETKDGFLILTLNSRFKASLMAEYVFGHIRKAFKDTKLISSTSGFKTELDDNMLAINAISNRVYGADRAPYIMAGGTYARLMSPAVAFGMGSPLGNRKPPFPEGEGRAHQRNESVDIERMKKGFIIYVESLKYLDGVLD